MSKPNYELAQKIASNLLRSGANLIDRLPPEDEGRTYSLAMMMFVGAWMATLRCTEHREEFCQAALSYAEKTEKALDEHGAFPGRRMQ